MTARLIRFLTLVLRLVPPLAWWALAGLVFSILNEGFHQELWPNTPAARPVFISLLLSCLMALPWVAAHIAWHLSGALESFFWKSVWRFVALAGYVGATLASGGGLVAQGFMWHEWLTAH
ncbi:hypothetical protein SAMN02745146_1186 [Hymenobacter daecheongensis DSM 21074]|uniref:Uncharacterized protein n=1 Tax=Hymenobacter daecheongensis DSM 21074 TaxID=1121955 RepID=A0A1M6CKU7_9BACT|nr:hypothetical protein [Hymenobacter daecheongensis]SHI61491.1 hypothetical protein SAMN02745146_1186 [Hymenobacter daecheongensis DSM 21074]